MRRAARSALLLDVLAAAGALWAAGQAWQTLHVARLRPLADATVAISGRTLDGAGTALAVVALAGAVALVATRGVARRIVGGLLVLAGLALAWRSALGLGAMSTARALDLVTAANSGVGLRSVTVGVHRAWPLASLACGALVALAGTVAAVTGASWSAMSSRYETPARRGDASLWGALDRGDDPTVESRATGE